MSDQIYWGEGLKPHHYKFPMWNFVGGLLPQSPYTPFNWFMLMKLILKNLPNVFLKFLNCHKNNLRGPNENNL